MGDLEQIRANLVYRLYLDGLTPQQRGQYDAKFLDSMREAVATGKLFFDPFAKSFGLIGDSIIY